MHKIEKNETHLTLLLYSNRNNCISTQKFIPPSSPPPPPPLILINFVHSNSIPPLYKYLFINRAAAAAVNESNAKKEKYILIFPIQYHFYSFNRSFIYS